MLSLTKQLYITSVEIKTNSTRPYSFLNKLIVPIHSSFASWLHLGTPFGVDDRSASIHFPHFLKILLILVAYPPPTLQHAPLLSCQKIWRQYSRRENKFEWGLVGIHHSWRYYNFYKHMANKHIKPLLFKNKHIKPLEKKIST